MGGTVTENNLELIVLEELEDSVRCEMSHTNTVCSHEVTHLAVDCRRDFFVCKVAYTVISAMRDSGSECAHCSRKAADCWRVMPAS